MGHTLRQIKNTERAPMHESVAPSTLVSERPVMHLVNSADIPRLRTQRSKLRWSAAIPRLLGPLAALIAALLAGARPSEAALAGLALTVGLFIGDRRPSWQHLLPLAGRLVRLAGPAL